MRRYLIAAAILVAAATPSLAQTRAISASDKAQGAAADPKLLAEFGGRYDGPQAAYVDGVGKRVAVQSGLSNSGGDFTIALLDSPVENAFAIPGGYVYVTRQLLALMNSEAELASVLGHEVGHVAARHANSRNTRSTIGSILAAGAGMLTGSDFVTRIAGTGAQLYTLRYGRNQEYEADGLGVRYITAAGYDPYAASTMLTQLNAETTLEGRITGRDANAVPGWASTHPNGLDRIARARALAAATGRPRTTDVQDTAFLRMLDGMAYDDDPAQGIVDGREFRQPRLRVRFTAPVGYTIDNGTDAVTVAGNGGQAQFRTAPATTDLPGFVTAKLQAMGAQAAGEMHAGRGGSIAYTYATVRGTAGGRAVDATVVAYAVSGATDWFTLITAAGTGIGPFEPLLASVAPLTAAEAGAIRGKRVRIVTVKAGDTIDSLAARMAYPAYRRERFVTLNGLDTQTTLVRGSLVKVIVQG